ncbi:MAG TPA: hypothetical protein VFU15_07620, partial [Bacteroidia bacterium]|nr:hypothetical protein [Bacteroidia bacterium]
MKFRFSIGRKILLGFAALILLVLIAFSLTLRTIRQSREINDTIAKLYTPSVDSLQEMRLLITNSKALINNWISVPGPSDDKPKLKILLDQEYPQLKKRITHLSLGWSDTDRVLVDSIFVDCEALWVMHRNVMNNLSDVKSYNDPGIMFDVQSSVLDNDGVIVVQTKHILARLDKLKGLVNIAAAQKRDEMLASFQRLQFVVVLLLIVLPVGGLVIALLTARTITRPVHYIKNILLSMAKGILPNQPIT